MQQNDHVHLFIYRNSFQQKLIKEEDLVAKGTHRFLGVLKIRYVCPCRGRDHFATRSFDYVEENSLAFSLSPVLHCYEHGRMWMVVKDKNKLEDIFFEEEGKYQKLVDGSEKIVKKYIKSKENVSGKILAILQHTHGIDPTVVESLLVESFPAQIHNEFDLEMEIHKSKSGKFKHQLLAEIGIS